MYNMEYNMAKQNVGDKEKVFIGPKDISKYLSACFYSLGNDEGEGEVQIIARGNNVKRAIDVAAILLRQHLDIPNEIPTLTEVLDSLEKDDITLAKELIKQRMTCEVKIDSEKYDQRYVSTIEITIRGKKKKDEEST